MSRPANRAGMTDRGGASSSGAGTSERIRRLWQRLSSWPGGKWLFSILVGRMAPYTGTIGARVEELDDGHARLTMRDRRRVRNHLESVHAVAQLNLAEETTGLAISYSMPAGLRGIPVHLEIDYTKKARGTITAVCELTQPFPDLSEGDERVEYEAPAVLTDPGGDIVARALARWVIGR